jgi:hypothetical protein
MERVYWVVLHGTLGRYLRDVVQGGRRVTAASFPTIRAYYLVRDAWFLTIILCINDFSCRFFAVYLL